MQKAVLIGNSKIADHAFCWMRAVGLPVVRTGRPSEADLVIGCLSRDDSGKQICELPVQAPTVVYGEVSVGTTERIEAAGGDGSGLDYTSAGAGDAGGKRGNHSRR